MSPYKYDRKVRDQRKNDGLCDGCGAAPRREGKILCQPCAEAKSARAKAKRVEAKEAGLCGFCLKNKAAGAGRTCQSCLLLKSAALRKMRRLRAQAGVCAYCGRGQQTHGVGCSTCAEKARRVKDRLLGDSAPVRTEPPKPRKPKQQPSKTCPLCKDKHRADSKCCPSCLAKFCARRAA